MPFAASEENTAHFLRNQKDVVFIKHFGGEITGYKPSRRRTIRLFFEGKKC